MSDIHTAMVLAAGLGRRLQPLTDHTPKPLVKVQGRALIDYALDLVRGAGLSQVVINCHHLADQIETYAKSIQDLTVKISDERGELLETGGGVQKALPLLGNSAFAVINSDVIVRDSQNGSLKSLIEVWDPEKMDVLLLLQEKSSAVGYDGEGDFTIGPDGRLTRRHEQSVAPYIFSGVQIVKPEMFDEVAEGKFSMNVIFDRAAKNGRLYGSIHTGMWLHVGTVNAISQAEEVFAGCE
ncbi:nucleotidyltransferase family protein [Sneathiella glossodoripedis]|uniref:nucleotidyltransferase family protein n=1 Tax=Sneathiella glossodoripedis TaxID=418853 RepID=UPI00046FB5B6|nr:nucleotidyltransferase family protein [Sneathiella glossodoripedis]